MPSSSITIYFYRHLPSAFDENFQRLLLQHDILVMEFNIRDDGIVDYERDFLKLSKGELSTERMLAKYPKGDKGLFKAMHRSGKRLILEKSPVTMHEYAEYEELDRRAHQMKQSDPVGAVGLKWKALGKFAEMNARRDIAMAEQIAGLFEGNPGKRVLVYRGPGHERKLLTELKARGIECDRQGERSVDPESQVLEKLENGESVSRTEILELLGL